MTSGIQSEGGARRAPSILAPVLFEAIDGPPVRNLVVRFMGDPFALIGRSAIRGAIRGMSRKSDSPPKKIPTILSTSVGDRTAGRQ